MLLYQWFKRNKKVGIIFLDIWLPGRDGLETLKAIKEFDKEQYVVIKEEKIYVKRDGSLEIKNKGISDLSEVEGLYNIIGLCELYLKSCENLTSLPEE